MTTEVAGSSPAPTQEAQTAGATTNDFSAQQWAAAAAMQNAYAYGVKPPDAGGAAGAMNGQSVTNQMNDATRAQRDWRRASPRVPP